MSDKDEQRKQGEKDEAPDVEGHMRGLNDQDATDSDDQTPDIEGHLQKKSPVRQQKKMRG